MGARVYNPATNQFTSPDPVKRGNENRYTYPNNPIEFADFSGLLGMLADEVLTGLINVISFALGLAVCGLFSLFCMQAIKFVLTFLVMMVVNLVEGADAATAFGDAFISASIALIPGMNKSFLKRTIRAVKILSKTVARKLKKLKLKRLQANLDRAISASDVGSAVYETLAGGDFIKIWVL
jgi:hypothetical protein